MTYTPKTDWVDTPSHATPVLAAELIRIEQGIADVEAEALAGLTGKQPADTDLTAIAALDSTQAGVVASDGAGWLRKTYAAVKTALGLTKGDVGLGNVDNTSDVNKPVSTAQLTALNLKAPLASPTLTGTVTVPAPVNPTDAATRQYVDTAVTGLLDFRGSYDASPNTFPAAGGSGTAGAVVKGDVWISSVGGTLGGVAVTAGDLIVALADAPGQTAASWDLVPHDGAYVTLAGNQTVAGVKTFSSSPVVPTPAAADNSTKTASTAYSDAAATAAASSKTAALVPTPTKTAPYIASVGDLAMMNVPGGAITLTLPTSPADKSQLGYVAIGATTAVPLTINRGGSDTIGTAGLTTTTVPLAGEMAVFQYDSANTRWLAVSNVKSLASLDARYAAITAVNYTARGIWAASGVYAVGDTVFWQAQTWICTTAHTAGANFDASKFAAMGKQDQGLMAGINFAIYGHSWTGFWATRLGNAINVGTIANRGVGGSTMPQQPSQIAAVPTSSPNVYFINSVVNDAVSNSAAYQGAFKDGLRAWLDFARAPIAPAAQASYGRLLHTGGFSYFAFTGTWSTTTDATTATGSRKLTSTNGDSFKLDWWGDAVSILLLSPASGSGAAYSVTSPGGAVLATGTVAALPTVYQPIRLSGYGPGWHTVTVTKTDATTNQLIVDCAVAPVLTPPTAVVVKDPPVADGGHPYTSLYAGLIDTVVAEPFTANAPIVVVDIAGGTSWDTNTDIGPTPGFHPSDQGSNKLWKKIYTQLAVLPYRAGQNTQTYAESVAPKTPVTGSDNFTRADNPASLGVTSTGGYPWKVVSKGAVFGIASNKAIVTAAAGLYQPVVIETGKADCTLTWVIATPTNGLLVWRADDAAANFYFWWANTVWKYTSGSVAGVTVVTGANPTYAASDTATVILSGSTMTIQKNGVTAATYTDAALTANTQHGVGANGGTAAQFTSFAWA